MIPASRSNDATARSACRCKRGLSRLAPRLCELSCWRNLMPKMTGARLFAEMMRGYEVSHIFFVPAFMLKAFAEMEDMPIRRVMVHGEKAAAYMADGYARASGKPGVCMAQMIGASNLAAGLRGAHQAGEPLHAINSGTTP